MLPAMRRAARWVCALSIAWASTSAALAQPGSYPSGGYPGVGATTGGIVIPAGTAARLRALDADLDVLGTRSQGRVLDGALQVVAGAAFTTIGVFIEDDLFRSILFLTGSVSFARGVVQLTLMPDAEMSSLQFEEMPLVTAENVRARLRYGEEALSHIARRTRLARIIDGSVLMTMASVYVPAYWALRRSEDSDYKFGEDAVDYVGIALAGITFAVGVVTTAMTSDAERRAEAYDRLRTRLEREHPGEVEELGWLPEIRVAATRGAVMTTSRWRF